VVPPEFKKRPFTLNEAREAGLTRKVLRGKSWRRIGSSLYCWAGLKEEPLQLLQAWHRRLPNAIFTGLSAAWLYRLDVDPCHPVDVTVPPGSGIRSRPGLVVHRAAAQAVEVRGLPATTLQRTFADLRRRLPRVELLVLADEALRLKLGRFDELAEPAESPMETRLRWLLIDSGLPRPEVQVKLSFGRADLYYRSARLVIEYDGANHRDRLVEDNRRQNLLINAGYRVLRFTASDRPQTITAQVRLALASGTTPPAAAMSA
jgi:very-short-patch-repair endonuclease